MSSTSHLFLILHSKLGLSQRRVFPRYLQTKSSSLFFVERSYVRTSVPSGDYLHILLSGQYLSLWSLISRAIFAFQYFVPSSHRLLSFSRKCLRRICISCAGGSSRSWEHLSLRGSPACRSKRPCCMDITRLAYLNFQCCKYSSGTVGKGCLRHSLNS